jgi:hypothetical protein
MKIKSIIVLIFISGVFLFILEISLGIYYNAIDKKGTDDNAERIYNTGVYKNIHLDTVKTIYRELRIHNAIWEPYVHYRLDSMNLKFSKTNDKGLRRTLNLNLKNSKTAFKIYCFGGSTMFGFGARDSHTIPSELSKLIYSNYPDLNIEIVNYGTQGYTRSMENIQFMNLILEQNEPHMALFYDGANEVLSAYQNNKAGMPMNGAVRKSEFGVTKSYKKRIKHLYTYSYIKRFVSGLQNKLFKGKTYPKPKSRPDSFGEEIATSYIKKLEILRNINLNSKTKIYNFLQPNLYSKKNLTKNEIQLKKDTDYYKNIFELSYSHILKDSTLKINYNFHNLSGAFNFEKATIFTDFCHTGEFGNKIIAEKIYHIIKQDLITKYE